MTAVGEFQPAPALYPSPSRWALWALALVLLLTYVGFQFVFVLPVGAYLRLDEQLTNQEDLLNSEPFLLAGLAGLALSSFATLVLAWRWPTFWRRLVPADSFDHSGWLAWRPLAHLRLWQIPLITLPFLFGVNLVIGLLFGPAEVEIQVQLFRTTTLRFVAVPLVTLFVPIAEELIFRGALYNALESRKADAGWQSQCIPFLVSAAAFALLHIPTGFDAAASISQIVVLSLFLSGLRAATGSVQASIAAHMSWNLVAALGYVLLLGIR